MPLPFSFNSKWKGERDKTRRKEQRTPSTKRSQLGRSCSWRVISFQEFIIAVTIEFLLLGVMRHVFIKETGDAAQEVETHHGLWWNGNWSWENRSIDPMSVSTLQELRYLMSSLVNSFSWKHKGLAMFFYFVFSWERRRDSSDKLKVPVTKRHMWEQLLRTTAVDNLLSPCWTVVMLSPHLELFPCVSWKRWW